MRRLLVQLAGRTAGGLSRGFRQTLADPGRAQRQVEGVLAADLARTALGRQDGLSPAARSLADIPPRTWEELAPWVELQRSGEFGYTPHPTLFEESTSGSSGAAKRIPYTAPLREAFTHLFLVWAHDLIVHGPGLRSGKLFMSVSPRIGDDDHDRAEDDTAFVDGWVRALLRPFLAVPPSLSEERDPARFQQRLIAALLDAPDVEVFSIWNPSLLKVVLDAIVAGREEHAGRLSGPRRRALLADPPRWTEVWPDLRLISCWQDGHAAPLADQLARRFPGVLVQGKGLLATEGPVTVPLIGSPAGVPLIDRVLIELIGEDGRLLPLHEAATGARYELVLSFPGGLPRYRIGDRVDVVGSFDGTPCLRFAGRGGGVSDLVGEKLNEAFVAEVLQAVLPDPSFRLMVPLRRPRDHYALLLDREPAGLTGLAASVDEGLRAAHHYRLAQDLGQLGPVEVLVDADLPERYLRALARGARLGDVKPRLLLTEPADGWAHRP